MEVVSQLRIYVQDVMNTALTERPLQPTALFLIWHMMGSATRIWTKSFSGNLALLRKPTVTKNDVQSDNFNPLPPD